MSTWGNSAKVGLVVLIAGTLIAGMFAFFAGGLFKQTYTLDVLYDDASGISKDAPVQMAGVQIGRVSAIALTPAHQADLTLEINKTANGRPVEIPRGSQFLISTPLLGGTGALTIVPPADAARRPNDVLQEGAANLVGARTGDLNASMTKANRLIEALTTTVNNANALLTGTQGGLKQTVANVNAASANVNAASANGLRLTNRLNGVLEQDNAEALRLLRQDNAQVQGLLRQTRAGSQVALNTIVDTTAQIKGTTAENRAQIREIVANLRDTTAAVSGITMQTNDLLSKGDVTKNLSATVANLKATTDKLNTIAGNFQSLTGDPAVQGNLRQTLQNVRDTSEEARLLLARLNKLAGTKRPAAVVVGPGGGAVVIPPPGGTRPRSTDTLPLLLPRVDLVQNTRASHFRADVDAFVPLPLATSPAAFARAGLYDVGGSTRINLQYGQAVGPASDLDYRYGLYASRLGVGGDYGLGRSQSVSFEFYDPNRPHLDAYGRIRLAPELGLLVGGEDLLRQGGGVIGLEYRRSK